MPSHLKALVRARMEKTGETYQQALRHVRAQEQSLPVAAATSSAPDAPGPSAPVDPTIDPPARSHTVADTAFSIAAVRAEEEARPEGQRLFRDPYAAVFAAAGTHAAESTNRFLELPFFRDGVRLRTRYLDDAVRDGLAAGLTQVVLLGAGFDARGLRLEEIATRDANVFEVDTPYQLDRKRRVLAAAGVKLPKRIAYVPFEFDTRDLEAELEGALEVAGFERGAGAMFVWEGVIGYIDEAAMDASLRFMANAGGPRSRVAFTFADESHLGIEPMTTRTKRCGFSSLESLAGDALWRKYHLPGEPPPTAWVTKVGVAIV